MTTNAAWVLMLHSNDNVICHKKNLTILAEFSAKVGRGFPFPPCVKMINFSQKI